MQDTKTKRRNDENEIEIERGSTSDTPILASETILSEKEQGFLREMAKSRTGAANTQDGPEVSPRARKYEPLKQCAK